MAVEERGIGVDDGGSDMERAIRVARFVAEHWKAAALDAGDLRVPARWMAYPLNLVLDALAGEVDPVMLGIGEDSTLLVFRKECGVA